LDSYKILETNEYINCLSKLPNKIQEQVGKKTDLIIYPQLRIIPHYGKNIKKLKNFFPETWRYRISDYRLFYTINESDKMVNILSIEHRKDAY
jgi:mRNA interferase RelE/StbE